MNRLRAQKLKINSESENVSNNSGSKSENNGLLNKLTKRYSTLSNKLIRKQSSDRQIVAQSKTTTTGSYNMTGSHSDDHRLEIGAPILISTTILDTDRLDVSEERLKQIGGGIAVVTRPIPCTTTNSNQSSPQCQSSSSENETFVDAIGDELSEEEKYEMAVEKQNQSSRQETPEKQHPPTSKEEPVIAMESPVTPPSNPLIKYYEVVKPERERKSKLSGPQHSKSAQNLHRCELKVFLQKTPSEEMINKIATEIENSVELPKIPELFGASKCSLAATNNEDTESDKENSFPTNAKTPHQSKSEPNTPYSPDDKVTGFLAQQQQHFRSVDSLEIHRNSKRRSVVFSSNATIDQHGSKHSLISHNSTLDDFNLKSVSCQSLNAQSLFVSIDELNEITRQINESEDFNREIDLEYCTHRDNLKPSERRITLLKNKNTRLLSFNNNKEKIKKGWSDVKHWIGEEKVRLKDVMQKQAAMQRVGASKLNLSNPECRQSPSVQGSVVLQANVSEDRVGLRDDPMNASTSTFDVSDESATNNEIGVSCDNIAEDRLESECDDLESSLTHRPGDDLSPATKRDKREGQNGFEELRRYIKQGGDFGKELILILQERVESELLYSKSLSKMATKLNKATRELPGSIADAWRGVATEMENRSDIHRQLSVSLIDEIVKPLKTIVDSHHKTRKTVESNVDKAARVLAEWRISEGKAKKASHTAARENEKLQDAMLDVRIQKSPSIALLHQGPNKVAAEKEIKSAEKDCAKLDNKRKKAEEAVKRADVEYYTLCVRAERARVDWEMAVLRGSSLLQNIENQRLINMKNFVSNYTRLTADMNPILDSLVQRLQPQIDACNVTKDMQVVKNIRRNSEGPSEQLLPDFYCEHTTLAMNRERRKHALIKLLQLVKADLERERRSRNGLKGLSQSLNNQEFQNITDKLYHIRSMLTYLEGARFKLHSALLELDHKPRTSHPLAQHIQITRDRTGLQQSILKVPLWLKNNEKMNSSASTCNEELLRENDYDVIAQAPNAPVNGSCMDISDNLSSNKNFNRSKSNVETLRSQTQICLTSVDKTKTNPDDPYSDRGQADGGSNQQDSDFDEFSSQDDDDEQQSTHNGRKEHKVIIEKSTILVNGTNSVHNGTDHHYQNSSEVQDNTAAPDDGSCKTIILSRCKALYNYTPKLYDELELTPGDIIEVHAKQEDGWWLGALRNQIGIFPATYVEEIS